MKSKRIFYLKAGSGTRKLLEEELTGGEVNVHTPSEPKVTISVSKEETFSINSFNRNAQVTQEIKAYPRTKRIPIKDNQDTLNDQRSPVPKATRPSQYKSSLLWLLDTIGEVAEGHEDLFDFKELQNSTKD